MYICLIGLVLIILSFYIKNKNKDNSYSMRLLLLIKKEYPILCFVFIGYILYNYIFLTLKSIKINPINFVEQLFKHGQNLIDLIGYVVFKILNVTLNMDIFKIIFIGYFINKLLTNKNLFLRFKEILKQIKEFSYGDFSMKVKEDEARKEQNKIDEEIKNKVFSSDEESHVYKNNSENDRTTFKYKEVDKKKIKKELIALMIDNTRIVNYLYDFIKGNAEEKIIPLNLIPKKIKLYELQKVFTYKETHTAIIINGLNNDIKDLIKETFEDLWNKGIIYCDNC